MIIIVWSSIIPKGDWSAEIHFTECEYQDYICIVGIVMHGLDFMHDVSSSVRDVKNEFYYNYDECIAAGVSNCSLIPGSSAIFELRHWVVEWLGSSVGWSMAGHLPGHMFEFPHWDTFYSHFHVFNSHHFLWNDFDKVLWLSDQEHINWAWPWASCFMVAAPFPPTCQLGIHFDSIPDSLVLSTKNEGWSAPLSHSPPSPPIQCSLCQQQIFLLACNFITCCIEIL